MITRQDGALFRIRQPQAQAQAKAQLGQMGNSVPLNANI